MKFTLESFDFSKLTDSSVVIVEVQKNAPEYFQAATKAMSSLILSGKIPGKALLLLTSKDAPLNIKELPEDLMNRNGWVKVRMELGPKSENNHQPPRINGSEHNP